MHLRALNKRLAACGVVEWLELEGVRTNANEPMNGRRRAVIKLIRTACGLLESGTHRLSIDAPAPRLTR